VAAFCSWSEVIWPALPTNAVLQDWAKSVANGTEPNCSCSALVNVLPLMVTDGGHSTVWSAVTPCRSSARAVAIWKVKPGG